MSLFLIKKFRPDIIFLLIIFITFWLIGFVLLLKEPLVWPDEAIYADVVLNVLAEGRMGTDLWQDALPSIQQHAFWNPPLFFILLSIWIKTIGFSIVKQRLLSLVVGAAFLVVVYFFTKGFIPKKKRKMIFFLLAALVVEFTFSRATRVSRPEIFVLFFGTLSLLLLNLGEKKKQVQYFIFSGLSAGFATLNHVLGIFFFITIVIFFLQVKKRDVLSDRNVKFFTVSFIVPIVLWILSVVPSFDPFIQQLSLASSRKSLEDSWLFLEFKSGYNFSKVVMSGYLLLSLLYFLKVRFKKKYLLLTLSLALAWFVSLFGKMFWYSVFPIPYIYICSVVLISQKKLRYKNLIITLIIGMVVMNVMKQWTSINDKMGRYSYEKYINSILNIVPNEKTVFLSAIPDPYFGFKSSGRDNVVYEFPGLRISSEDYQEILNDTDYIVYTRIYHKVLFGDFLDRYISANTSEVIAVGEDREYRAFVIKLVDRGERVKVEAKTF